ncbi:protein of unknown function [Methylocella tundrae]|uniref:Uncharacterized protein n=1 Tax=Methylocella tundrae TaxID=227605 RepID=A0A4U8Z1L9_METTU|nr:protein of unknown function [Methylocella tundrae]
MTIAIVGLFEFRHCSKVLSEQNQDQKHIIDARTSVRARMKRIIAMAIDLLQRTHSPIML